MRDFLNFRIEEGPGLKRPYRYTMRHREKEAVSTYIETDLNVPSASLPDLISRMIKRYAEKYRESIRRPLTARQQEAYNAMVKCYKKHGGRPTYQDIADAMGVSSRGTAKNLVSRLIERGWVWVDMYNNPIPIDIAPPELDD